MGRTTHCDPSLPLQHRRWEALRRLHLRGIRVLGDRGGMEEVSMAMSTHARPAAVGGVMEIGEVGLPQPFSVSQMV